jgi:MraZ protein
MFLGSFEPRLLESGRMALPKKIRNNIIGASVVLTIGFEDCIFGFDESKWHEAVRPELEKPVFSDIEARNMRRKMFMNAFTVEIDTQGRIILPASMIEYAKLKDNIVVVGAGDHFEIWGKKRWIQYSQAL